MTEKTIRRIAFGLVLFGLIGMRDIYMVFLVAGLILLSVANKKDSK